MIPLLLSLVLGTADTVRVPVAPGESLRVVTMGQGDPVVFLPGLFGSAYGFRHVTPELAATGHHAVVIEPLGFGGSSRPKAADYSLTAQADRITAVLDSLRIDSAVVVAHSVAGSIALRLAYRHPSRVRAVLSLEGPPEERATGSAVRRAMTFAPLLKLLEPQLLARFAHRELEAASVDSSWITEEVIRGYTAEASADYKATIDALRAMSRAEEPERLANHLDEILCPVLLLVGGPPHRSRPSEEAVALLRDSLPSFTMEVVPETGHFIHEERPESVVAAIMRFSRAAERVGAHRP